MQRVEKSLNRLFWLGMVATGLLALTVAETHVLAFRWWLGMREMSATYARRIDENKAEADRIEKSMTAAGKAAVDEFQARDRNRPRTPAQR